MPRKPSGSGNARSFNEEDDEKTTDHGNADRSCRERLGGGKAWARAEQSVLNDLRVILDAKQQKRFDSLTAARE